MPEKLAKTNQSVEKVLQIIETMSQSRDPLRLQDIALKVEMPASTTLRLINTLMVCGYANQDPNTLRYSLSLKFMHIGSLVSSQTSIRDIAHPYLIELSKKCKESVCLAIEQNMEVIYIDVIDGPDGMLRITQRIGKIAPMHSTGVGKLMLLNYDVKQINNLVSVKGLSSLTPNTIIGKDELLKELEKIRIQGFALDNEECELGARCISASIKDYTGKVVAGISVSGPITRMTMDYIETIKNTVISTAQKISELLAYNENINSIS
ncbi:MAG: IclR family transcriptional regulator [Bacillota bacterium]|jgi:DNA-binding IclR family transcriptional regulator|nr:IclR family transcriptional regulator [Bacillota bacterium]